MSLAKTNHRDALDHVRNHVVLVDTGAETVPRQGLALRIYNDLETHHSPRVISTKLFFLEGLQDQTLPKLITDFTKRDLSII